MEKVFISVKDRANEEREPMKVAKERADQFLRNLNRNGKRTFNGKPQFYIVDGSEESQTLPDTQKKRSATNVVAEVVTKTEFSPEKIRDYISKAQTLGALDRIVAKVGEGYETEIEARKLEIGKSNPLEQKQEPTAKAESKPKSEAKPKEDKPKSTKTNTK